MVFYAQRETGRQTGTVRQADRQTDRQTETGRQTDRQREREVVLVLVNSDLAKVQPFS